MSAAGDRRGVVLQLPLLALLVVAPFGGLPPANDLLAAVHALAALALAAALVRRPAGAVPAPLVLATGFAAWCVLGTFRAAYGFGSFTTTWDVLVALAVLLAAWRLREDLRRGPWLGAALLASACLQGAVCLWQAAAGWRRAHGTFLNPNHLGAWLNLCLGLAAARLLARRGRDPLAAAAAAIILVVQMVLASRGALLALVVVAAVAAARALRRLDRRRRRLALAASAAAALLLGGAGWLGVARRFSEGQDVYRHSRLQIWSASLRAAAEHPVAGIGPGMYEHVARRWNFPRTEGPVRYGKWFQTSHSQYLDALVETGAVGLGLLLLTAGALARGAGRRIDREDDPHHLRRGFLLGLGTLLVHGLVEPILLTPAVALTAAALAGAALAGGRPAAARRPDPRLAGPALGVAAAVCWAGIVAPWLGERHFQRMQRAPDAASFRAELAAALRYNPYQPYFYDRAARAILGSVRRLDLASYRICYDYAAKAVLLNPTDPRLLVLRAAVSRRGATEVFGHRAGLDEALATLEAAAEAAPTDPGPAAALAALLLDLRRNAEARDWAGRALAIEPAFLDAQRMRERALRGLGREQEAERAAEQRRRLQERYAEYRPTSDYEAMILGRRRGAALEAP